MRTLPPSPSSSGGWFQWALQLTDYLLTREKIDQESLPQAVQLPHKISNEKALADGLLMYDPVAGEPVYSKNGQWVRVSDGSPV